MVQSIGLSAVLAVVPAGAVDTSTIPPAAAVTVDFEKDVQPIFEANCLDCHGPKKQKSDFRVDSKAILLTGGASGDPSVIIGKSVDSPLIHFISGLDEDMMMPPKGDPLTPQQIGILRAWIDQGAHLPEHANAKVENSRDWWSLTPLQMPPVPAFAMPVANPIDAFLAAKRVEKNLTASPEADRRTLIRRATLTLTGLPPTPAETESFVKDADPKAYEKLVDRLLASPHFGERWAQHWLDVVRFAESNGSESNLYRVNAWPYRDYVVRAFNEDKPFNRFVQEQIAGDVLGVDEATGYLVSGMFVTADTVGKEEQAIKQARADRLDETVQTVSASLLGLTMACARCHNHKFDPIPQKDYYAMTAVFEGLEYGHRTWNTMPAAAQRAIDAANVKTTIETTRDRLRGLVSTWTEDWPDHLQTYFNPVRTQAVRFLFPAVQGIAVDEIEVYGPSTGGQNLALASRGAKASSYKKIEDMTRPVSNVIDGIADRYHDWRGKDALNQGGGEGWIEIELPAEAVIDHIAISADRDTIRTTDYFTGKDSLGPSAYQIEVRDTAGAWNQVATYRREDETDESPVKPKVKLDMVAKKAPAEAKPGTKIKSGKAGIAVVPVSPAVTALTTELSRQARAYDALLPQPLFAGYFIKPPVAHLLGRGDPADPREEVEPNALSVLEANFGLRSQSDDTVRRLAFAQWLTDPQKNPLTPRVLANRFWVHVFGIGIVETPGDFGKVGGIPTHPELLDWLAAQFVDGGWSAKQMIRMMVLTDAFRQSSAPIAAFVEEDAQSRYLWRFPPRRIEAEVLRDATLAVAGTLDPSIGGIGFRIHADKKRFEGWQVVDNAGPTTWRRMIYQERMRGIDDRMFTAFDRPECGQVTPRRTISTTPLQALNLFNGEFILVQAAKLAERIVRDAGREGVAPIQRAFALVLNRAPTAKEISSSQALVAQDGLPALCRALLNTNEYAFLE